jgi:hypothetical protein
MSSTEHSDYDKETLVTREDQDAQVSSDRDELNTKETQEIGHSLAQREVSVAFLRNNDKDTAGLDVDIEKDGGTSTSKEDEPQDPNVVWWDGPDDPADPLNWSNALKVINVGLVSGICLVTPLASCMDTKVYFVRSNANISSNVCTWSPRTHARVPELEYRIGHIRCVYIRPRLCIWSYGVSAHVRTLWSNAHCKWSFFSNHHRSV